MKFVLSGEEEFFESGLRTNVDFKGFYTTRLDLLAPNLPTKTQRKRREDLLKYYNEAIFPEHHTAEGVDHSRSHEEQELWKAMQAEGDEED